MLRLLWSPWSLAEEAFHASTVYAHTVWVTLVSLEVGLVFSGMTAGSAEPYASLLQYCWDVAFFALLCGAIFGLLPAALVSLLVECGRWLHTSSSRKRDAAIRIVLLSPRTLLLPVIAWTTFAALDAVSHPSFGLGSGKPTWITSPLIPILCSPWWLVPALVLLVVNCRVAIGRLATMPPLMEPPTCEKCGYNLTGNVSGICPECGRPIKTGTNSA